MKINPTITVLMPVYNSEKYLRQSIESILNQTFADFEFLIINDGSTDGSSDIANSFVDERIRIINNEKNLRLIKTLNKGLGLATGQYIARMDSDDISLPDRLQKQVLFMKGHPDVAVCGSWVKNFGNVHHVSKLPSDPEETAIMLLFENAIAHPSSMIRKEALKNILFRGEYVHAEDYDLWARLSLSWRVCNLPEVLLKYRVHRQQISRQNAQIQKKTALKIKRNLLEKLGFKPTEDDLATHWLVTSYGERVDSQALDTVEKWLQKLIEINNRTGKFSRDKFAGVVSKYWKNFCMRDGSLGLMVFKRCINSPLYYDQKKIDSSMVSLLVRSLIYSIVVNLRKIV